MQLSQTLIKTGFQAQVLEKLTDVTVEDIQNWANECHYTKLDRQVEDKIEKVYGPRKQVPMIEVEEWLENLCREFSQKQGGFHKESER